MKKEIKGFEYFVVDVFTTEKYKGNPLAVIITNSDLPLSVYKDISKEFGYSETSFVRYSEDKNMWYVRSFTPTGYEINGAGHNLLGAVHVVLFNVNEFKPNLYAIPKIIMKDKPIAVSVNGHRIGLVQRPATIKNTVPNTEIAGAISVSEEEICLGKLKATIVKTEVAHLMVHMRNVETLNNAKPKKELLKKLADQYHFQGIYCFALNEKDSEIMAETRFFNPAIGIEEDPATGSAAGPLAGLLYHHKYIAKEKNHRFIQGRKMNRNSTITICVKDNGILVSGKSVITMEGIIYI